ncbi:MAG: formate--tetrahydrofolate ligase [Alphaproteobacteria bacterium]|jgi:formate--tetrahydrofolate ligase|nr:formate--tetrahydrofolate ligase [Alphaproteobacteria bacterium]PPR13263.1 MAG: Formate--tetrahydrofolate ligase [Alphaproteobacteria bacterium MarineAlpha12_Bin1]|tara:strand:+ start:4497 stop:6173 length:1677 start_codon:yes stop_codon:yes gene_type:complete
MMQIPDIEIARNSEVLPIKEVANNLGVPEKHLFQYGPYKAKIDLEYIQSLNSRPRGKLILVTALTPTPAGEGKTTTTVGLGDGLNKIGKKTVICIREPSLGPCFGIKGGAAGGGYSQVVPMEDINLHFTGDIHAISSAHNLMSALIDNHVHWGNNLSIDVRKIDWRRVIDINDRALRQIVQSLGGPSNGIPRESGFDITVASEVMAIFCLATSLKDLERRLGNIVIGSNKENLPITVKDLSGEGSMAVLLKDALMPNLVQTLEHTPAFVHGGPFANIAHGCNSIIATDAALHLSDYVVTEAGFGADLGAEKFFNIKCRKSGLEPAAAVVVATVRALKMHGGVDLSELKNVDVTAVSRGLSNLRRHISNIKKFGVPVIVAINRFSADSDSEIMEIKNNISSLNVDVVECNHWKNGSEGIIDLATKVSELVDEGVSQFQPLYEENQSLFEKINIICREIYGAKEAIANKSIREKLREWESQGFGKFPICIAKTQYSFSTDPNLLGAPKDHVVPIREVRLSAGAEFVVAICGQIMTLPGLPSEPAANNIRLDDNDLITGLF